MALSREDAENILTLAHEMRERIDQREAEIKSLGEATQETKNAFDAVNRRIDEIETKAKRPGVSYSYEANPGERNGFADSEVKSAVVKFWRKGAHVLTEAESKALSIADSAHAGYLVPDEIRGPIIERLVLISQFRPLVTQYTISSEAAKVPVERGQYAAYMISESGTRTESQSSEIGEERIPVHEGVALVVVSNQLLEDAAFPLDAYIQRKAAERIAKLQGQKFVSGTGRGEPEGILTNGSVAYVPTTDAALLKPDAFITMAHQLQTYYAQNAKWGMNRKTVGIIRGFKDSQNRYLWEPAVPNGNPAQILGIPYVELPDMPDVASNAFPVVLGDFESGYNWIDRIQMEMQRLTDSTYALKGQVGFLFRTRFGGQTVLAEAMLKMKVAVS